MPLSSPVKDEVFLNAKERGPVYGAVIFTLAPTDLRDRIEKP
jgi:hypothetical protein